MRPKLEGIAPARVPVHAVYGTGGSDQIASGLPPRGELAEAFLVKATDALLMLQAASGLDLTDLITHRIRIDQFEDGFAAMLSGQAGKVVMDWG